MWTLKLVGQGPVVEKKAVLQALRTPLMSPNKALYEVIQLPVLYPQATTVDLSLR